MNNNRLPLHTFVLVGLLPGFLKKAFYRMKGYKIGKKVKFSIGSIVQVTENCTIGDYSSFGNFSMITCRSLKIGYGSKIRSIVMISANDVIIGNEVTISETSIIRAGHISNTSNITIENRVHIFPNTIIDPSYPVLLKEECAVGFYSNIYTHGSYKNILDGYPVTYGEVIIGKRVELTYNVFVAPGVSIGDDTIVGYGSYVNSNLPDKVLAAGCPAKIKRTKEEFAPTPSNDEKNIILRNIITEFCDIMQYRKFISYYEFKNNNWTLINNKGKTLSSIDLIHNNTELPQDFTTNKKIFVILDYKESDKYLEKVKDLTFFDISRSKCSLNTNNYAKELRSVFSRYGIRFDTIFY